MNYIVQFAKKVARIAGIDQPAKEWSDLDEFSTYEEADAFAEESIKLGRNAEYIRTVEIKGKYKSEVIVHKIR